VSGSKRPGWLPRFDPIPGQQKPRYQRNGAITLTVVLVGIVLALTVGYSREIPFLGGGETVHAEFTSAPNLRVGNPVRVRGIKVGKVTKIEQADDLRAARVTMELDSGEDIELKRDARAQVLWRTLLGRNMYVDLEPGSASAPKLAGDTIDRRRTSAQVEFDQLFEPLDTGGRGALQTLFAQLDVAFDQPGPPGQALERLAPAMRTAGPGLEALRGERSGDLARALDGTRRTMRGLGRSERALAGLLDGAAVTLGVTAARRADLGSFLRLAPATLRETRATTARLRHTLDLADPVATRVRPGVRRLDEAATAVRPALLEATPVLRDADPLARRLQGALRALRPASREGVRAIDGLDPTLTRTTDTLLPWLAAPSDLKITNAQAIGPMFSTIDSAAQQFNAFGHQLRFQGLGGGERSVGLPCATFFVEPTATQRLRCEDFSKVFQALIGGTPTRSAGQRKGG
jgi:virulence factor Mce-like protein